MRPVTLPRHRKLAPAGEEPSLSALLEQKLIGQPEAISAILPYVEMFNAALAPEGRPAGVFLLLGPTGTGKTRTVEVLADALHDNEKSMIKVDCGEFQMEHEVAKLIGSPPGYLGHRETPPVLTQQKLNAITSERNSLSVVLFDEIEKAAPSMTRLLLGILDKATLRLGDNTTCNFERTLIFLTSNLGAQGMSRELGSGFGFARAARPGVKEDMRARLESIAVAAVRRKFTPEFVNRIDAMVTYQPLDRESLEQILELQLTATQEHIDRRLGVRSFTIQVPVPSRKALLDRGVSLEYGARELKRTIHRNLLQPLATKLAGGLIPPRSLAILEADDGEFKLRISTSKAA